MASANSNQNVNDKLVIFKGDDTGGVFGRSLQFAIEVAEGADLTGCRAEWIFDGIVKTLDAPLTAGETREIFYSHNETERMCIGVRYGTFRIIDSAGKRATMTNTRAVEVTDNVARCYPGASAATVRIGTFISWENISGKPLLVKTVNGEAPDASGNINIKIEEPVLDDTVTEKSPNGVKSSGIWSWVKSLLPHWLTSDYAEPATVASVANKLDKSGGQMTGTLSGGDGFGWIMNRQGESLDDTLGTFPTYLDLDTKADRATTLSGYGITDAAKLSDIIDPALAAAVGKIADAKLTRDFVNLMASTNSAHYLTARAGTAGVYTYPPFASAAALRAALAAHTDQNPQFFYAGEAFTPTKNDWVIVSADEDHPLGTITPASRYGFVGTFGSGGSFQYQVSYKLPLTTAQIAALDSGATSTRLSGLESDGTATDDFATDLLGKQVAKEAIIYKANTATGLKDRAFNALSLDGTEYNLSTALAAVTPTVENQPRDLLIVATATASTTISFTAGTIKGDKPTIDGAGTWLITLTEYEANTWYCRQIKMEDAA